MDKLRELHSEEITDLLKRFLTESLEKQYLQNYVGKIIDNNDPQKLGRCKVRVYSVYDDTIPDNDLPWAIPEFQFIGSSVGNFIVPKNDTLVNVYFNNGNIYEPIYTTKVLQKSKLPSKRLENYPDNMVFFETDEGDSLVSNRDNGKFTFTHRSGLIIEVSSNGDLDVKGDTLLPNTNINIYPGVAGSVNIGRNPIVPCPDANVCYLTGGPLATRTLIPGSQISIP